MSHTMIVLLAHLSYANAGEYCMLVDWGAIAEYLRERSPDAVIVPDGAVRLLHWDDIAAFSDVYDQLISPETYCLTLDDPLTRDHLFTCSFELETLFEDRRPTFVRCGEHGVTLYVGNFGESAVVPYELIPTRTV